MLLHIAVYVPWSPCTQTHIVGREWQEYVVEVDNSSSLVGLGSILRGLAFHLDVGEDAYIFAIHFMAKPSIQAKRCNGQELPLELLQWYDVLGTYLPLGLVHSRERTKHANNMIKSTGNSGFG